MKRQFLYRVVLFAGYLSLGFYSSCLATPDKETYKYPSVQELYNSCKQSIEDSRTPKDFLNTYCAGRMTGLIEGELIVSAVALSPDVIEHNKPSTGAELKITESKEAVKKILKEKICFEPMKASKGPLELLMAKDYIAYIDQKKLKKLDIPLEDFLNSSSQFSLSSFFINYYSCQQHLEAK